MLIPFWSLGIVTFLGMILFLLLYLYLQGTFRLPKHYPLTGVPASSDHYLTTLASLSDSLMTTGLVTGFWSDIDAIQQARLELIAQARSLIQFETFKLSPGQRASAFADALCQKAREGVEVQWQGLW
jgi:cardiolipin synthase